MCDVQQGSKNRENKNEKGKAAMQAHSCIIHSKKKRKEIKES